MARTKKVQSKKKELAESANISKFIAAVCAKNYASAHKYLTDVVNSKIQKRISKAASKPLF